MSAGFVNIKGEPVDLRAQMDEAARRRYLERKAAAPEKRKPTVKRGYAAQPGTGPEGETCKTCKHKRSFGNPGKHFVKCGLRRDTWTHGEGTDILARSPACSKWGAA